MMHTRYPVGRVRFGRVSTSWLGSGLLAASVLVAGAGCDDKADSGPTGFEIKVAPLTLPGITDACYSINVYNSTALFDASTAVWSKTGVCASDFGDGSGSITYVGTCDASETENTVELTLQSLWTGGAFDASGSVALTNGTDFVNPCTGASPERTCRLVRPCNPNADTLVEFNLTIMRNAQQGFFDIVVNFEDIFCSAKFDCEDTNGDPLELLFNGTERDTTAVMAFACTAGENADTTLYMSNAYIICDVPHNASTTIVGSLDPSAGPGNVASTIPGIFGYAVYEGKESLGDYNKAYWNMSIGVTDDLFKSCSPPKFLDPAGNCVLCPSGSTRYALYDPQTQLSTDACFACGVGEEFAYGTCYPVCNEGYNASGSGCIQCPASFPWDPAINYCQGWNNYTAYYNRAPSSTPPVIVPFQSAPYDVTPRSCYIDAWASASDGLWPKLSTPEEQTYPYIRYRVPLNPPETLGGPASASLDCGVHPLNGPGSSVFTSYDPVGNELCFENVMTADWDDANADVASTHYRQYVGNWWWQDPRSKNPLQCQFHWESGLDMTASGGEPGAIPHLGPVAAGNGTAIVHIFLDTDEDGEFDAGESYASGINFRMRGVAPFHPTNPAVDLNQGVNGAAVTVTVPNGNYSVAADSFYTWTPNVDGCYLNATTYSPVTYTWNPNFRDWGRDFLTVGGVVPNNEVYIGVIWRCPP
jgi:hypothetical protein